MSENQQIMIQISGLKKRYRLGTIGGGTLTADLQSWWARIRGKEDPNAKIGAKTYGKNETFMALDGIDLTVYKGERLGIIGHNGAGKSTLLKLLSRVTGPTEGEIGLNGRISSMLEVGTGFNPELTGRENIYLNGAILGMTKAEVDKKIDQIIEFSECSKFIDTPVKRYSSGMYVKLAFAVAAHLDSEILVMDEVLAVGDMKFQQKCLGKMSDVSKGEGRTVLYVSHNMNTIRQLCNRCIVLDHGKIIFDGDVEEAIGIYSNVEKRYGNKRIIRTEISQDESVFAQIMALEFLNDTDGGYETDSKMQFNMKIFAKEALKGVHFRFILKLLDDTPIGMAFSKPFELVQGLNSKNFTFDMQGLPPGKYQFDLILSVTNDMGAPQRLDIVNSALDFYVIPQVNYCNGLEWGMRSWGYHKYLDIIEEDNNV